MSDFLFTSDTHFDHKLMAGLRGFNSVEEHNEAIITAWNEKVSRGDVIYHLGDFSLPQYVDRTEELLRKLNGDKHLLRGNHDRKQTERAKGWAWVGDYRERKIGGHKIVMLHYALRSWHHMGHGALHLYGHSHGNLADGYGRSKDVGIDTNPRLSPYSLEEVVEELSARPILVVDHHRQLTEGDHGGGEPGGGCCI